MGVDMLKGYLHTSFRSGHTGWRQAVIPVGAGLGSNIPRKCRCPELGR